jgi:GNAT superfamily N-acetyltransferase
MSELRFDLLSPLQAPRWKRMTFPRYGTLLHSAGKDFVALAATVDQLPAGLAFAHLGDTELLSLWVLPSRRRKGVGQGLIAHLEIHLRQLGCPEVRTVWMSGSPGADAFARLLQRQDWATPQLRMVVYKAFLARLGEAEWMHNFAVLPEGCALVPWASLTSSQLVTLKQAIHFENWVPADLDPFAFIDLGIDGAQPEPSMSLACTQWGDVVGWNLAHRINANTVRISCTYVRPDMQQHLLILALWREAFQRQAGSGYQNLSWAVAADRSTMVTFNDRFMGSYVRQRTETWGSRKELG